MLNLFGTIGKGDLGHAEEIRHLPLTNAFNMPNMFRMATADDITTGQIADQLKVDRTTVHYWVRTGKLTPTRTVAGVRYFNPEDVEAFGEARALLKGGQS